MTCSLTLKLPPHSGPKAKPHRFHLIYQEILLSKLRNPLSKNVLIKHEFLILHVMRNLDFLWTHVFSGTTALTAFNRNAKGVNGVLCRYKGVNGVLLES